MKLSEIDRWMTRMTDALTSAQDKLNPAAGIDLVLGKKLGRLNDGLDKLTNLSNRAEQEITRLTDKVDKLADTTLGRKPGGGR